MAQNRAAVRNKTVPDDVDKLATESKKTLKKDLADPTVQWEILNPETMRYPLQLPDGVRKIEVKTAFSLGDIYDRRIFEDMQAFRMLVVGQARRLALGDEEALAADTFLINAALLKSVVREEARAIMLKMTRFVDPPDDAPRKPTLEQLAVGMKPSDLAAFSMYVLNRISEEEKNQKNGDTTAPK